MWLSDDAIAALHRMRPEPPSERPPDGGEVSLSKRIVLRRLAETDASALAHVLADPEVSESAGLGRLQNEEDVRRWIVALDQERMSHAHAIVHTNHAPIGAVVLRHAAYGAALSYWLAGHLGAGHRRPCGRCPSQARGTALGTEHIVASIDSKSVRSGRLLHTAAFNASSRPGFRLRESNSTTGADRLTCPLSLMPYRSENELMEPTNASSVPLHEPEDVREP